MRYVEARLEESDRLEACRIYYADALKALTDNTAAMITGGSHMSMRLTEVLYPVEPDERTQEEIVSSIWAKIDPQRGFYEDGGQI